MSQKRMFVFAGPNGSGKSTIVERAIEFGLCPANFISPDNFVHPKDRSSEAAFRAAQAKADAYRHNMIALGESFSFETVLSIEAKLDFIKYAKFHGYFVYVVYVTTCDPKINLHRIEMRVAQGGHGVPTDKVLLRYKKSMELMFDVIHEADRADVFDNSGALPLFVAAKIEGTYWFHQDPPKWLEIYLKSKVERRGCICGEF